jgi:hypothetical protein
MFSALARRFTKSNSRNFVAGNQNVSGEHCLLRPAILSDAVRRIKIAEDRWKQPENNLLFSLRKRHPARYRERLS